MGFLNEENIRAIGFASFGQDVKISDKASFYNPQNINIGNHVRIDDYCVLSAGCGGIVIGSYVHIAVYSSIIGAGKIELCDFSNISSRVSIYSSNDDYSGGTLTSPTIPNKYKNVFHNDVIIGRHAIVGCGSVIMPGAVLGIGVAIGALSYVNKMCEDFYIYAGVPVRKISKRKKNLLLIEKQFIEDQDR
jgi:galactoside O-acetyltransferase